TARSSCENYYLDDTGKIDTANIETPLPEADILFCGFHENISRLRADRSGKIKMHFRSCDVADLIDKQLKMRELSHSGKKIIVVVDTSLGNINDDKLQKLISRYANHIL